MSNSTIEGRREQRKTMTDEQRKLEALENIADSLSWIQDSLSDIARSAKLMGPD
jgi:hypothetical protein